MDGLSENINIHTDVWRALDKNFNLHLILNWSNTLIKQRELSKKHTHTHKERGLLTVILLVGS